MSNCLHPCICCSEKESYSGRGEICEYVSENCISYDWVNEDSKWLLERSVSCCVCVCVNCSFILVRDLQYGVAKNKIAQKISVPLLNVHGQGTLCMYWGAWNLSVRTPRQLIFIWWCQILQCNYCSPFPYIQKCVCQFTCREQKAPANNDIHRSLWDSCSWVRNLLCDSLWVPRIWKGPSRFFGKFLDPCEYSCMKLVSVASVASSCNW